MAHLLLLLAALAAGAGNIVVPEAPRDPVRVTGLSPEVLRELLSVAPADWEDVLGVYVDRDEPVPPMLGRWSLESDELLFTPRLSFVPGLAYRVVFRAGGEETERHFLIPAEAVPTTAEVLRIYPTADTLPQNLLRFYVYFSEPMRGGDVYERIHLIDGAGEAVKGAFVETVPELWDPWMQRVTLILHPGRIKRGLELHDREGPALIEGERFLLRVDVEMQTAAGSLLRSGYQREFGVIGEDRESPDPALWSLLTPTVGTLLPLRIQLDETLDHALLARMLSVEGPEGSMVEGALTVASQEQLCLYTPQTPWKPGPHQLVVDSSLEDLSGNRVDMLFDRETTPPPEERQERRIPFTLSEAESD